MRILYLVSILVLFSCENKQRENHEEIKSQGVILEENLKSDLKIEEPNLIDSTLIILDTTTNLIWMKEDFSSIEKRFLNNWNEIFEWQNKINSIKYAGFDDWRVPNIKEYRSINKNKNDREFYKQNFIEIDSNFFWGSGPYAFWSSTTPNEYTASYISFKEGFAVSGNRGKQKASGPWEGKEFGISVRLVRE